uniref:Uncharacterized protein n=1 Tax=Octopus bimaculoides TaxID=37653 RepID=A0A0L8I9C0_OCTBM
MWAYVIGSECEDLNHESNFVMWGLCCWPSVLGPKACRMHFFNVGVHCFSCLGLITWTVHFC